VRDEIATASKPKTHPRADASEKKETVRDSKYKVLSGDTLQSISSQYYGDSSHWNEIYKANKENIGRGGALSPGQVLNMPVLNQVNVIKDQAFSPPAPKAEEAQSQQADAGESPAAAKTVAATPKNLPGMAGTAKPAGRFSVKHEAPTPQKQIEEKHFSGPRTHIVQKGENLQSIAKKYYNDASKWKQIYEANKRKLIGGQATPAQELIIPQ
jgi:nucleoid-associated protein YgaU